jgi:dihydrodipicolinate synthase/N-acetylneuraminate lyase
MRFEGILPAVPTPFHPDGAVDHDGLRDNARWLLGAGVHGLVGTGTMGEAGSLDRAERRAVVATLVREAAGAVPVVAGISAGTPAASVGYATDAAAEGADAVMLLPPLAYRGDDAEIVAFYRTVADAIELPVMAYNNPEASGTDMGAALVAAVAEVEGVVAVKECSGDVRRIPAILHATDGALQVLVGGDDWALEGLAAGATGWVSGVAVVAPEPCVELWQRCRANDLEAARAIYRRLLPLARFDMTPKLVQYFKAGIDEAGHAGGPCRPPRGPLRDEERAALRRAMRLLHAEVAA